MVRDAREERAPHHEGAPQTPFAEKSFNITKTYCLKLRPKSAVTRGNGDAVNRAIGQRRCHPAEFR
jgi:hypothetical protein